MANLETLVGTPPWEWPDSARAVLLAVLRDPGAPLSDRVTAAELLNHAVVMDDEVACTLLSVVQDGQQAEALRGQAAISLGPVLEQADVDGFEDADMVPITEKTFRQIQRTLHKVYADAAVPRDMRRRALEAAVRAPQDWQKAAVRSAWGGDDAWKVTAVFAMGHVRGFESEILEALESRNEDMHYEAVTAAGNMELDAAWPHVAALIKSADTEKHLLLAAIDAVATIRPAEALEVLADLADHRDQDVVEAVHEALTMARGLSAVDDEDEDLDDEDEDLEEGGDLDDVDLDDDEDEDDEGWEDEDEDTDADEEEEDDEDDDDRDR
jgi:hypothetical protein